MSKKSLVIGVALAGLCALPARAAEIDPPSPFEAGLSGFGMGIGAGLAGGYLVARSGGFHSGDWKALVAGGAIGALAGGVVGLTMGFIDNESTTRGRGFLVVRDMAYGGWFGAVFGGLIGGLFALKNDRPENILFGAAIGTLSGTVAGLVYGSVERNPWGYGAGPPPPPPRLRTSWNLGVAPLLKTDGTLSLGPSISGRF